MDVELLVVTDCPHEKPAASMIRSALDDVGLTAVNVELAVIVTEEDGQRRGFVGSPTILLKGIDPFEVHGQHASVSCRLYPGTGGLPDLQAFRKALKRAAFDATPR